MNKGLELFYAACSEGLKKAIQLNPEVERKIAKMMLNHKVISLFNDLQKKDFEDEQKGFLEYLLHVHYLEKVQEKICARKIQKWFLTMYYSPYHPYGKARLERDFSRLAEELSKK